MEDEIADRFGQSVTCDRDDDHHPPISVERWKKFAYPVRVSSTDTKVAPVGTGRRRRRASVSWQEPTDCDDMWHTRRHLF